MSDLNLEIGITGSRAQGVETSQTAASVGSGMAQVFATPMMVALVEKTCYELVQPLLSAGESSVGTRMEIDHVAPTPVGMEVRCQCRLDAIDGRRLRFSFTVCDEAEPIGRGIHERFIINAERFQNKADNKTISTI